MSSLRTAFGPLRVIAQSANKGTTRPPYRSFHNSRPNAAVYPKANKKTLDQVLKSKGRVVLVHFYADWCRPCHMLSPILEKYSIEPNKSANGVPVDLVKVDTESEDGQYLTSRHNVYSLPTVRVFKNGKFITQIVGAQPEAQVKELLDSL